MKESPEQVDSLTAKWRRKFACALRGLAVGILGQNSFYVHLPALVAVVLLGSWLQVSLLEWTVLILCITIVLSAEFFNTSLEHLARSITHEENPHIRNALDIASGAVLIAAAGAALVGLLVLLEPLWQRLQ